MKKRMKTINNENGFSLIEVMIAIAIFSAGVLATLAMQYAVVKGNTSGNVVNQEMMMGQWIVEQKKNEGNVVGLDSIIPGDVVLGPYTPVVSISNPLGGTASRFLTVTIDRPGGRGGHPITIRTLTMGNGI